MITRQIFNAPTPQAYDPSEKIDRSFQRLGKTISGAIENESIRKQTEQKAFGELYSNLGEIEGKLQENYAGMQQQMIDSTREFLKNHYKSGKGANDVDFQKELGERTGRIKASIANADRIRQEIKQYADIIKDDESILPEDKNKAMTEILAMANNADVLISKNPFDGAKVVDRYVNPTMVFQSVFKRIPSDGADETTMEDDKGNLKKNTIIYNRLIPRDKPVLEDGSPNIVIPKDFLSDVEQGKMGERLLRVTEQIAEQRYGNLPRDVAMANALRDGFRLAAGSNFQSQIIETADQRRMRDEQLRLSRERLSMARKPKGTDEEPDKDRFERFKKSAQTGKEAILGDYVAPGGKIQEITYVRRFEDKKGRELKEDEPLLGNYESWLKNTTRGERNEVFSRYGVTPPSSFGATLSADRGAFERLKQKFKQEQKDYLEQNPNEIIGIGFLEKTGVDADKKTVTEPRVLPLKTEDDIEKAYNILENARRSGANFKKETDVPTGDNDPMDLTDMF